MIGHGNGRCWSFFTIYTTTVRSHGGTAPSEEHEKALFKFKSSQLKDNLVKVELTWLSSVFPKGKARNQRDSASTSKTAIMNIAWYSNIVIDLTFSNKTSSLLSYSLSRSTTHNNLKRAFSSVLDLLETSWVLFFDSRAFFFYHNLIGPDGI